MRRACPRTDNDARCFGANPHRRLDGRLVDKVGGGPRRERLRGGARAVVRHHAGRCRERGGHQQVDAEARHVCLAQRSAAVQALACWGSACTAVRAARRTTESRMGRACAVKKNPAPQAVPRCLSCFDDGLCDVGGLVPPHHLSARSPAQGLLSQGGALLHFLSACLARRFMVFQPPEWASQPCRTATLHVRPC